jgi:hypothetical protein
VAEACLALRPRSICDMLELAVRVGLELREEFDYPILNGLVA